MSINTDSKDMIVSIDKDSKDRPCSRACVQELWLVSDNGHLLSLERVRLDTEGGWCPTIRGVLVRMHSSMLAESQVGNSVM